MLTACCVFAMKVKYIRCSLIGIECQAQRLSSSSNISKRLVILAPVSQSKNRTTASQIAINKRMPISSAFISSVHFEMKIEWTRIQYGNIIQNICVQTMWSLVSIAHLRTCANATHICECFITETVPNNISWILNQLWIEAHLKNNIQQKMCTLFHLIKYNKGVRAQMSYWH